MRYPNEAWQEAANTEDAGLVSFMLGDISAEELNQPDENGVTPLMVLAEVGFIEAVVMALEAGADPSLVDSEGRTAASYAQESENSHLVEILKDAESSVSEEPGGVEVELNDGGFEEASGAYLVEATLSRPVESVFSGTDKSDKVSLYESRMDCRGRQVLSYRVKNTRAFNEAVKKVVESFGADEYETEESEVDDQEFKLLGKTDEFGYSLFETTSEPVIFPEFEDSVKYVGTMTTPYDEEVHIVAVYDSDIDSAQDWVEDATGGRVEGESANRFVVGINVVLDDPGEFVDDISGEVIFQEDNKGFTLSAKVVSVRGVQKFTVFANDEEALLWFLKNLKEAYPEDVNRVVVSSIFIDRDAMLDLSQSVVPEKIGSVAGISGDVDELLNSIEDDLEESYG